jgi:hypothetical protein
MRILEVINSNTNLNTFRDLGGLEDLLERIKVWRELVGKNNNSCLQVEIGVISELPKVEEKKEELKIEPKTPRSKGKVKVKTPTKGKGKGKEKEKEKDTKVEHEDYQPIDMELFSENNRMSLLSVYLSLVNYLLFVYSIEATECTQAFTQDSLAWSPAFCSLSRHTPS